MLAQTKHEDSFIFLCSCWLDRPFFECFIVVLFIWIILIIIRDLISEIEKKSRHFNCTCLTPSQNLLIHQHLPLIPFFRPTVNAYTKIKAGLSLYLS